MKFLFTIQFLYPIVLFLLVLAPFILWFDHKKTKLFSAPLSSKIILSSKSIFSWRQKLEFVPAFIKMLAYIMFVLALARPQHIDEYTNVKSEGIDILLAIDTSLSMQALDMRIDNQEVTRLDAVKNVVKKFIAGRLHDQIGMVVFGEKAYTQCPLTTDYTVLSGFVDMLESGMAGNGTAIGNGLATSVKRLMKSTAKSKIVILLTDGRSEAGEISPEMATQLALEQGIKVYTIGVGSNRGVVPMILKNENGLLYKDVVNVGGIDVEALKTIADVTQGQFYRAQTLESLEDVYHNIDSLEKSEVEQKKFKIAQERFDLFLIFGLFLYFIQSFLRHHTFLRVP